MSKNIKRISIVLVIIMVIGLTLTACKKETEL